MFIGKRVAQRDDTNIVIMIIDQPEEIVLSIGAKLKIKLVSIAITTEIKTFLSFFAGPVTIAINIP